GVRINIDVLNAQRQLFSTQRDLAIARYDALQAKLELLSATGDLDTYAVKQMSQLISDSN
ncbi:MAG: channel protein TolC, partial [Proteobacteria bacterium]|nr:channel protein TolC [Pseudomonadota bacterium]